MDDNVKKDQPINSDSRQSGSRNSGNNNRKRSRNNYYNRNKGASGSGRQNTADKHADTQSDSRAAQNQSSGERAGEQGSSGCKPQNDRQRAQNNGNNRYNRNRGQNQRKQHSQNLQNAQQRPESSQKSQELQRKSERSQNAQKTQQRPESSQKTQELQRKSERSQNAQYAQQRPESSQKSQELQRKSERSQNPQKTQQRPERLQSAQETRINTNTSVKVITDNEAETVRETSQTVEKELTKSVSTEQKPSSEMRQGGEEKTAKKDDSHVNRAKSLSDEKMNRLKSDCRFWARLASVVAIIPIYLVLLVFASFLPRSTVSNIEKRNLATFPEFTWSDYWSGKYTSDVTHYFDDTVPFRDTLKQAASRFSGLFGIKYNDVQVSGSMEVVNKPQPVNPKPAENSASSAVSSDSDTQAVKQVKGEEIADGVYANGVIVVYQHDHYRAMSMYGGGYGETYAQAVNKISDALPRTKVYSLVAPTASEFYTPENFSDYNASQEDDIVEINGMLHNATGINICPTLLSHKQENIYTRTDHHWTALGAYYAAQDFAKAAGVAFPKLSEYNEVVKHDYVGTLYSFSGNNADLLNDPEDFVYYVPKNKKYNAEYYDYAYNYVFDGDIYADVEVSTEYYSTFIYGDAYSLKIDTGVKNGRRCLVVKESYGDALVPFLTGSFEEVYVVDMRYFERNLIDFANEMNITDLLVCCCSYSAVGPNADSLEAIRTGGIPMTPTAEIEESKSDNITADNADNADNPPAEAVESSRAEDETTAQGDMFGEASDEAQGEDQFGYGQDGENGYDSGGDDLELGLYTED